MIARSVLKVYSTQQVREGGGFIVRRVIGGAIKHCDPLLMLDHFGPVEYGPGEAIGAPDHPHRGFETVTYMIEGETQHKDSAGNSGTLGPGWVQWMTAGSGVVHSEMPSDKLFKNGGKMEGFQLWVNLPAKDKMIAPRYQDTPPDKIPVVETSDKKVKVKIIAGECLGVQAFIETRIPIQFLDICLQPGSSFTQPVPEDYSGFVYVWRGTVLVGKTKETVGFGQVALLEAGSEITFTATDKESKILLIAGQPINEPIVQQGPFVMNTEEEIEQAKTDYQAGRLGKIQGMEERMKQTQKARDTQQKTGRWNKH